MSGSEIKNEQEEEEQQQQQQQLKAKRVYFGLTASQLFLR